MSRRTHNRFFTLLLAASVAFLVLVPLFHHHHDGASHGDCSLCVAACQAAAVDDFGDDHSHPAAREEAFLPGSMLPFVPTLSDERISPRGPPR